MVNEKFQWKCQPRAEHLVQSILDVCVNSNPFIDKLQKDLLHQTSTRLFDWIDYVVVGNSSALQSELEQTGYISEITGSSYRVYHHPGAQLPRIVVHDEEQSVMGCAVCVDNIDNFLMVRGITGHVEGDITAPFRRCCVSTDNGVSLWVIERWGTPFIEPSAHQEYPPENYWRAVQLWKTRPRAMENEDEAMKYSIRLAQEIAELVGEDVAAAIVCEVERKFWQARNTAGQIQKNRQDRLGMGWANHDHHTFRSSRRHFHQLVRLFEILGFHCRERFYAGEEAGWGAQVMENSRAKLVLFLDVDLAPHELEIDFGHNPLEPLPQLGTIGLWCALHGDSILKAGMHHLEAQFMFEELTRDLGHTGVGMMEPFSNFPYLKQAFTSGEVWHVDPKRIERLLNSKQITQEQADKFRQYGAVGSHMENLQRREGYKGFNEKNVSFIIKKTDPRKIKV